MSLLLATAAFGQTAELRLQRGPHYVGEPLRLRVRAEGFDPNVAPTCEVSTVPNDVAITLVAPPSINTSTTIINNRVTQWSMYVFEYQVVAQKAGTYQIGPFTVTQDKRTARTGGIRVNVRDVGTDPNMRINLVVPGESVYPGQRVPIKVEWSYAGDLQALRSVYSTIRVRVPLFDQFVFVDDPVGREDNKLHIVTNQGLQPLKAALSQRTLGGQQYYVLSAQRMLVVEKPGTYDLAAPTARIRKVTRWQRDSFLLGRVPAESVPVRAVGTPQQLVIKPLPLDQAPPSFAGVVGAGFTIDVRADRSVVNVGDPITLTLTLQGDGVLQSAGLPNLSADATGAQTGLSAAHFRLPAADVAGTLSEDKNAKTFVVTVRALDEAVTEIPRIAYSWFNPQRAKFETTYSEPIALSVRPAQMVSAKEVVRAQDSTTPEPSTAGPPAESSPVTQARFDLTGADLAIEPNPVGLLVDQSQRYGGAKTLLVIYGTSLLVVVLAWWRRRAAQVDPRLLERRRLLKRQTRQITSAARLPAQEAASQIAAALRQIASVADESGRGQIDRVVAECDVLAYAPSADGRSALEAILQCRAAEVAQSVARQNAK